MIRWTRIVPRTKVINIDDANCVYQRSQNPILGFELKPNFRDESPDFIESYEFTNSHAQRDLERLVEREALSKRRVLLLGDSVVEGYGQPFSETISQQLEQLSNDTEVLNFGVSAYCTAAEVELLATKGCEFQPDYVVLLFVENDFDNFNREAFPLGQSVRRPALVEWLFQNSHLGRLAFLQLDLFGFQAEVDPVAWNQNAIGENNVAEGVARLRDLADTHGFEPIVVVWPRFEDDAIVDPHAIPGRSELIVEALASQNRIPTFRLSDAFRAEREKRGGASPRLLFSQGDGLHPSALGAKVAAQAIREIFDVDSHDITQTAIADAELAKAIAAVSQREPDYARVFDRLGNQLLKSGKPKEAIVQYQKALEEDPDNAGVHNNLGIAFQRRGSSNAPAQAVEHFRKAIGLNPNFAEAHFNLGNAIKDASPEEGKQHFIRAIQLTPSFVSAHFELSNQLHDEGRMKAAEAGYRRVLQLDKQHSRAVRNLAKIWVSQKRFAEARTLFERFVAKHPDDAEALNNLGAICAILKDRDAAISHLKAAVAADPNHPKAAANLRNLQEATGE